MKVRGNHQKGSKHGVGSRAMATALALVLISSNAFGESPAPAASPSPVASDKPIQEVCDQLIQNPPKAESMVATQKLQYCQAAKSAKEAAGANDIMWKVWTGVGTVCGYACMASFAGLPTHNLLCTGVTVVGGITDAVITKEFAGALAAIGAAGASYLTNSFMNQNKGAPKAEGGDTGAPAQEKDVGACISAASAAMQAFTKYSSMQTQNKTAEDNYDAAKSLKDTENKALVATPETPVAKGVNTTGNFGAGTSGTSSTGPIAQADPTATEKEKDDDCNKAQTEGGIAYSTSCAAASDANLPSFVKSPKFADELKNAMGGKDPEEFFSKNTVPSPEAMSNAMGGSLDSTSAGYMKSAVDQLHETLTKGGVQGSAYSGGGSGGGSSGGGGGAPDINSLMSGFMGQFMPKQGGAGAAEASNRLNFKGSQRSPAQIFEDTKLNIFDRVHARYQVVQPRMTAKPGNEGGMR